MDYVIQGLNESVCRESFCFVHVVHFTVSMIKTISKMLRVSETDDYVDTETARPWSNVIIMTRSVVSVTNVIKFIR
jgi:hypothetical protein